MPSTSHPHSDLFNRLLEGKLSPADTDALTAWLGSEAMDPETADLILAHLKQPVSPEQASPEVIAALEKRLPAILGHTATQSKSRLRILKPVWLRYAAAAAILLGIGIYFRLQHKPADRPVALQPVPATKEIMPGKGGAILTLADGRTVVLDSLGNGLVATQNGAHVLLENGQLVYDENGQPATEAVYNTMTTPKGRQFQLVLPDGTKAWLNAASSLRYPTFFAGKERRVEVTGEVYFEVAKNTRMPFRVKVNEETEIEVLGTHFNVNSYKDEASINTTLLEGSVRISSRGNNAVLKPGQQAQVGHVATSQPIRVLNNANVEKVMAWKNGVFDFQDASLEEVMRQLERWYDIDVVYEKDIPKLEFIGKMGRDLTLANVLRGLEVSKVHFRIEGRKLTVLP